MQSLRTIYQLKVTLQHVKPLIWRRVLVLSSTELRSLHEILQVVMGWQNCHLHQFLAGKRRYGTPDPDFDDGTASEEGVRISSLLKARNDRVHYEYDFGDGWTHQIVLEDILPFTPGAVVPLCTAGERSCPPEDVGGPHGYKEFLDAWLDPAHPGHKDMRRWVGQRFTPDKFDAGAVNKKLGKLKS